MTSVAEPIHPRDRFNLQGIEAQAAAFDDALRRERLHHAWLMIGPEGVGKASFAFRAARRLLGAKADTAFGPLGSAPDDPVSRLISSQSHPDLLVLERSGEGSRKVIPVEQARRLPEFFSKAPALGRYRVAIIDAVDDLNANGANAVLKTLEEPSGCGVLFLISHAPGRLLPTIRSRCRTLAFRRWTDQAVQNIVEATSGLEASDAAVLADMARGSPGRAQALAQTDAIELDRMAQEIVKGGQALTGNRLMAIAEGFRGGEGAARFSLLLDRIASAVQDRARAAEPSAAAQWAGLWERISTLPGRVDGLNLDRGDAFWSLVTEISATART
jgi:DNA polymerase-3 subunit delta'